MKWIFFYQYFKQFKLPGGLSRRSVTATANDLVRGRSHSSVAGRFLAARPVKGQDSLFTSGLCVAFDCGHLA